MLEHFHLNRDGVFAVSYCINPNCCNFSDPVNQHTCPNCGSATLLQGRYRIIQPLGKGSFGQTFEVEDEHQGGSRKVLKVLLTDYPIAVSLFQREARVLSQLKHPGIPKVEPDGYFEFWSEDGQKQLHCLVMEKIEGFNLRDWLSNRNDQPITQEQAITWLKQLIEILQRVHQCNYFHRDIKPSNIMRRPDNQLVLIDFGAVREATETYLHNLQKRSSTVIISPGYTPPEQADGRAVTQSDFYALGRTFVHLLTGIYPHELPENPQTGQLNWRNSAPQVSQEFADLIDAMMSPFAANRPTNAQEILQRLEDIENSRNRHHQRTTQLPTMPPTPAHGNPSANVPTKRIKLGNKKITLALLVSIVLLSLTGGVIYWLLGLLQPRIACDAKLKDHFSCGEEVLVPDSEISFKSKKEGVKKFADGNYAEAVSLLEKARSEQPSDPETLIYLNNARLANQKAYTIAVVVPMSKSTDTALEILRGIAQAQEEINRGKKINGAGLRVLIADDANNYTQAQKIAKELVLKEDILAVVGHYASEITLAALPIYQQHGLVLISPGSTSEELSRWGDIANHVFFRTVPNTRVAAQYLASYLSNRASQLKAVVFYTPQSNFSRSLREQFVISFSASGGKIVRELDLSNPLFNATNAINQVQQQGVTALGIFPDGGTTTNAFPNTLRLIAANQGRFWIVGSNTLYNPDTLQLAGQDALNRFVVVVTWHHLDSPGNPKFPQAARNLWKGDVSWRTATAYDASYALIRALEKQSSPSRDGVRQVLADENFQAEGATGTITFRGGDRNEPISTLVKVVFNCSNRSYVFVPVNYPTAEVEKLGRCRK